MTKSPAPFPSRPTIVIVNCAVCKPPGYRKAEMCSIKATWLRYSANVQYETGLNAASLKCPMHKGENPKDQSS